MTYIQSFEPLARDTADRLILGSMPGKASLMAGQYYAHPGNLFWPFTARILGFDADLPYAARCGCLIDNGIALWDVLHTCTRRSSLDADIDEASIVPNDFAAFLAAHEHIARIYFNGARAEQVYRRYVLPALPEKPAAIELVRLPSTSPANASIPREVKLAAWQAIARARR